MKIVKIKVSHNTWLEFPEKTPKKEIKKRIEKFREKAGKMPSYHATGKAKI